MNFNLTEEKVKSLITLAGFQVTEVTAIVNKYDKNSQYPWFHVEIKQGRIEIGARFKVIHVDWSRCIFPGVITEDTITRDDVTRDSSGVHAYTIPKALEYLMSLFAVSECPPECEDGWIDEYHPHVGDKWRPCRLCNPDRKKGRDVSRSN